MGVEWDDCEKVGQLIGIKTIVNEFVAFEKMHEMELAVIYFFWGWYISNWFDFSRKVKL